MNNDVAGFVSLIDVDLHKDTPTARTIAAKDREVAYRKIACVAREHVREFVADLPRPSVVAIESVGFSRWLWTEAEPIVDQVVLANTYGCRALAGRRIKTYREDAFNVIELLMTGRPPTAWALPNHIEPLRAVTRHRNGLSRDHARTLPRVESIMTRLSRPGPARMDAAGLQHLLASVERIEADDLMLRWQHERRPGRFSDAKAIGRYTGLRPTGYSSADKHRLSRICKTGLPDLRRALQQAAWTAICYGPVFKIVASKIGTSDKKKKAAAKVVVTKLLVLIWALARRDELYRAREPIAAWRLTSGTSGRRTGLGSSPGFVGHGLTG